MHFQRTDISLQKGDTDDYHTMCIHNMPMKPTMVDGLTIIRLQLSVQDHNPQGSRRADTFPNMRINKLD